MNKNVEFSSCLFREKNAQVSDKFRLMNRRLGAGRSVRKMIGNAAGFECEEKYRDIPSAVEFSRAADRGGRTIFCVTYGFQSTKFFSMYRQKPFEFFELKHGNTFHGQNCVYSIATESVYGKWGRIQ